MKKQLTFGELEIDTEFYLLQNNGKRLHPNPFTKIRTNIVINTLSAKWLNGEECLIPDSSYVEIHTVFVESTGLRRFI
jgi:hypothetical protein